MKRKSDVECIKALLDEEGCHYYDGLPREILRVARRGWRKGKVLARGWWCRWDYKPCVLHQKRIPNERMVPVEVVERVK